MSPRLLPLRPLVVLACALLLAAGHAQTAPATAPATAQAPQAVDASAPIPKEGNATFFKMHDAFLARGKAGPIGVLFLGDSITEGWRKAPHIWEHYYGKYDPANFGISGDQTQHVIWRIEHGELDGIHPKVVVLMLGTNNTASHTAAEIAAADRKIVGMIRAKLPEAKVLLLAIFPRGPRQKKNGIFTDDGVTRMAVINAVNRDLAKLDDGKTVRFLNINERFLGNFSTIPNIIMPDQLHPNAAGYQLWAEAMQPLLDGMMK